MPPASPVQTVTGSALLSATCSSAAITRQAGPYGWIKVGITYNDTFLGSPVQTVVHGTDSGSFLASVSQPGDVTTETWAIAFGTQAG